MVAVCLPIQAWVDAEAFLRRDWRIGKLSLNQCHWIEHYGIYDRAVIDIVPANIEKIRRSLLNWSSDAPAIFVQQERCFALRIGVSGIPELMGEVEISGTGKFARAGLSQNLDATESESFVFRREWILVDSNLANRSFGWKLATAETIDKKLSTTRTSGWTS